MSPFFIKVTVENGAPLLRHTVYEWVYPLLSRKLTHSQMHSLFLLSLIIQNKGYMNLLFSIKSISVLDMFMFDVFLVSYSLGQSVTENV